ncbi:MAG: hypothetical protein FWD73_07030 [Polyangiaceae bacterium]|nr:hypothetical protein [Polyangiaceae bacterium]
MKPVADMIIEECEAIGLMLLEKNDKYGNSAFDPIRIFSIAEPDEQLKVRIDDKISRIAHTRCGRDNEDTVLDLIGYLVLLRVYERRRSEARLSNSTVVETDPASPKAGGAA